MPYYRHLSARDKKIYDQSAKITRVAVPGPRELWPAVKAVKDGLEADKIARVERALNAVSRGLCKQLGVAAVEVKVLATRPSSARSELHGLYTRDAQGKTLIRVWMRTAARSDVVKFRTFMRTFLHEMCHHFDYVYFRLKDSLHTEGFFKRESSLMRQVAPQRRKNKERAAVARRHPPKPQMEEPVMDLGPNPVETILRQLQSKSSSQKGPGSSAESGPEEPDPAEGQNAMLTASLVHETGPESWPPEADEPTAFTDGTARVRQSPPEPDWTHDVDFDSLAPVAEPHVRVYDPGFDEVILVPVTPSPEKPPRMERPLIEGGEKPRQTKLPF